MGTREIIATLSAAVMLVLAGVALYVFGFSRIHKVLKHWPTINPKRLDNLQAEANLVGRAVERASSYTFTPARCLRRSIAMLCLLRLHGVESSLVIGINRFPFLSHAWVEVAGRAMLNTSSEEYLLKVIDRI